MTKRVLVTPNAHRQIGYDMTPLEKHQAPSPTPAMLWRGLIDGCNLICRIAPGYEAHLWRESAQILTGEPHADMNFAYIGDEGEAARHLQIFDERASARGLPMMVLATAATTPVLAGVAPSLGFAPAGEVPLMVCIEPRTGLASHPYVIEPIRDPAVLIEATPLAARTIGLPTAAVARVYNQDALAVPGLDYFIARRGGEVWSFVQTTRIGTQVGVWSMATPTEFQGQGAGRALLDAVLTHHRQRGAEAFYLMASSAGQRLYQGAGFQETSRLAAWLKGSSAQLDSPC